MRSRFGVLLVVWIAALLTTPGFLWARWLRRRALAPRFAARAAFLLLAFAAFTPFASCAWATVRFVTFAKTSGLYGLGTVSGPVFSGPILLAGAAALLLALLVLAGATARWHWFPRSVGPTNDPPYR